MHRSGVDLTAQRSCPFVALLQHETRNVPSFRMRGNDLKSSNGRTVGFFGLPNRRYAPMISASKDTAPASNRFGSSIIVVLLVFLFIMVSRVSLELLSSSSSLVRRVSVNFQQDDVQNSKCVRRYCTVNGEKVCRKH